MPARPTLAVFKFASCDGCQLTLLSCEDELLAVADAIDVAYFLEARSRQLAGPYDVGLVEGSVTTPEDVQRIQEIRQQCRFLATIGACATAGGIQALRNWADVEQFIPQVYPCPEWISTLATSTPVSDHVPVDFELRGCPISKYQLIELVSAVVQGRQPKAPTHSVCIECKKRGAVCVAVAQGIACLGPVTQAGCGEPREGRGAICPGCNRECFGCFGPQEIANVRGLTDHYRSRGEPAERLVRLTRNFSGYAPAFREISEQLEKRV